MTELDEYWFNFLKETNRDDDVKCSGDINFEAKGFLNDELMALVLSGKKTAFFSSMSTYIIDEEPLPVSGELYIVVDRNNHPKCVIEFANIQIVPYNEVTWQMAQKEGEDEDLQAWKNKQRDILEEEGQIVGFEFTPDIRLIYQEFRVIYK